MKKCRLCPRECMVDRNTGELGFCKCGRDMIIARYSKHMGEEPCISGKDGSGTIFFSHCNMRCVFCQNYDISILNRGKFVSIEEFSDICLRLQSEGVNNINLVTGTMYIPLIVEGLKLAKKKGLVIPIIYNCSGYEGIYGLKLLEGLVDVYLPDFKYYSDELAFKYSGINDYFKYAIIAIREMYRQVGKCIFNDKGIITRGLIVRHLVLPGNVSDSKRIIKSLYDEYRDNIYFSIMNQYTPVRKIGIDQLDRCLLDREYDEIIDYAYLLGVRCAFVQDCDSQDVSFIPDFNQFDGL